MVSEITGIDLFVAAFLGSWFVLSVLRVWPSVFDAIPAIQLVDAYVPQWNFFAPNPGVHDYHILYRDITDDGFVGVWNEMDSFDETAAWKTGVWNPDKRLNKATIDLVQLLLQESKVLLETADGDADVQVDELVRTDALEAVKLTIPYVHLLQYVSSVKRGGDSAATQFLVLRSSREEEPEPIFLSDVHSI